MKNLKIYAAIILILFTASSISAQTYNLKGWAITTGSGTLTEGNRTLFASFGQQAAGKTSSAEYTLYMGVIRPSMAVSVESIDVWVQDTSGAPNQVIVIPVWVSDVTSSDVISCDLLLTFDHNILTAQSVALGDVVPSGWLIVSNIYEDSVGISMAGATPLSGSGSLVLITFQIDSDASPGDTTTIQFTRCSFNEGEVPVRTDDGLFTVQSFFLISGYSNYYRTPYRAVPNTEMNLTEGQIQTTLTDVNGYYIFSNLPGFLNYIVTPVRIDTVRNLAVSSYDAALILRHAARIDTLDTLQVIAADVSGNGAVSAYDAGLILQYVIGLRHHFPAGYRLGEDTVDWAFRPPTRSYTNLSSDQTDQNYQAILYGDPSGNWSGDFYTPKLASQGPNSFLFVNLTDEINTAPISNSQLSNSETQLVMNKPDNTIEQSTRITGENSESELKTDNSITNTAELPTHSITYPVEIKDAKGLLSIDLQVSYDPNLKPIAIKTTETTKDFLVAGAQYNGTLRIGLAGATELNGNVKIMDIIFESKEVILSNPDFRIDWLIRNEGEEVKKGQDAAMGNNEPYDLFLLTGKPNPFANDISIHYAVPKTTKLDIKVYNSSGQVVKTLVNETKNYGQYTIKWNGSDEIGNKLTNGIYFIQMTADGTKLKEKVILTK